MNFKRRTSVFALLLAIVAASCGGQPAATPTPDVDAIVTSAVGTLAASFFLTQTALVPPATETFTPSPLPTSTPLSLSTATAPPPTQPILINTPLATPTFLLTPFATPTGTQFTPTANPTLLASGCNNLQLLRDETIPAGTVLQPREPFTKTWKVANTGTCDWVYLYHLVFVSGDSMGGSTQRLSKVIPPGKWTQLSVNLEAPRQPGNYTGIWRFADQDGKVFGSTLTVSIVVREPAPTPTP